MHKKIMITVKLFIYFLLVCMMLFVFSCSAKTRQSENLEVQFKGGYGQVEVGGRFAGIEFHKSRPLPSRISFYYPVANSIDLSTDYWKRYQSLPLNFLLRSANKTDSLGKIPYEYTYTPYKATFKHTESGLSLIFSYSFCDDLPVLILDIAVKNISNKVREFELQSFLNFDIRTSHTYATVSPQEVSYGNNDSTVIAYYPDSSADSSALFIINSGFKALRSPLKKTDVTMGFDYFKELAVNEELKITQLIGMCRINEQTEIIEKARRDWQQSRQNFEERVLDYVYKKAVFNVNDADIMQTVQWSKAIIATNNHYLDGNYVPMPCPAEYNFFFTHDLLLTGLGAVYYDPDFIKNGFLYLRSLTGKDSILAHARYWKDGRYQTEFCNPDNWNHLWFVIMASSYLKHTSDLETMRTILPIIQKSLHMMLQNKGEDNLMYAKRPDWWDIGNIYGARAYISILMYKVLQDYVYIAGELDVEPEKLAGYLELSEKIKAALVEKLWDQDKGYLLNMMDDTAIDPHYYAGSLLAAHYNILDNNKKKILLQTAVQQLLDENIGIRNAMPNDFHERISEYKFNGLEVGLPYFYFNGGVWPHNTIWYVLALNSSKKTEEAKRVIKKYMTIKGIMNSPNGIPSFYEYRITDPESKRYGEIDKPTFLWAGGFFLQAIYQIAGMHENSHNIYFRGDTPSGFENAEYDMSLNGKLCRIKWKGDGEFFKKITINGEEQNSAVLFSQADQIVLERGRPEKPYLANVNCKILNVRFDVQKKILLINLHGQLKQMAHMSIIAPSELQGIKVNNQSENIIVQKTDTDEIFNYSIGTTLEQKENKISLIFK